MVHGTPAEEVARVAVVTGAASGVGLATVEALRGEDARVIGVDRSERPPALAGLEAIDWVRGDVTQQQTWEQVVELARARDPHGAACLAACAADLVVAPFLDTPMDDWTRLFDVNVGGVLRAMKALMPDMLARGDGSIAVVCSVNSFFTEEGLAAYSTTKAALLHVVRSAALEYAQRGLRINAVCPGAIETPLFARALESLDSPTAAREAVEQRTPTGKILRPDEVAAVVRFLLSDAASGMSGAAVTVDGGLTTTYDFAVSPPE